MQRYFAENIKNSFVFLSKDDEHHLLNVMRSKCHDLLEVVIDGQVYLCRIKNVAPLQIIALEPLDINREMNVDISLYYCLPKGDKFELVLQKATELGVKHIYGVISSRSIVRLKEEDHFKKRTRYLKIINEAACQSKRNEKPIFHGFVDFQKIDGRDYDHAFIAYEEESLKGTSFYEDCLKIVDHQSVAVIVGPEGGFSALEIELAQSRGFKPISLGKRILRSETAVINVLSVLSFVIERK